jgi:tetratricopeptide (TPR) repeat protein
MEILEDLKEENKKSEKQEDAYDKLGMEEPMFLEYLEGLILLAMNKPHLALSKLLKIQERNPYNYQVALNIAQIFLQRKKYELAEAQFIRALNIDDSPARAHHGLGLSFLRRGELNAAIEEFLIAIECDFFFHRAHYHLGEALVREGLTDDAIKAFEVNLRLVPGNVKAHKWLHKLYSEENRNLEKANIHLDFLRESLKGERIILTEAIEQNQGKVLDFIQRLGIPTYDAEKYGERAKNLHLNAQWLDELSNEVIFIPSHSLSFLPDHFHYKLIYLQTDVDLSARLLDQRLNAVLSTKKMETMELEQRKIEAWIDSQAKLPVLYLSHESLIEYPEEQSFILDNFLGNN